LKDCGSSIFRKGEKRKKKKEKKRQGPRAMINRKRKSGFFVGRKKGQTRIAGKPNPFSAKRKKKLSKHLHFA